MAAALALPASAATEPASPAITVEDSSRAAFGGRGFGRMVPGMLRKRLQAATALPGQLAAGGGHSCAIRAGRLYCWGDNWNGQMGVGQSGFDGGRLRAPAEVSGGFTDWTQVVAGSHHVCGLRSGGQAYCWGYNTAVLYDADSDGVVEQGEAMYSDRSTPTALLPPYGSSTPVTDWVQLAAFGNGTCGRRATGQVYCWGSGNNLINNAPIGSHFFPYPIDAATDWTDVALGHNHMCARKDMVLYCWGNNDSGQVGDGTNTTRYTPVQVQWAWADVAVSYARTCATRSDGFIYCWGAAGDMGLGSDWLYINVGSLTQPVIPVDYVAMPSASPTQIVSSSGLGLQGPGHSCALVSGRVYCWGANGQGQAAGGNTWPTPINPDYQDSQTYTDWVEVAAGSNHSCARRATGAVYCWGNNYSYQLGSSSGGILTNPFLVPLP